MDFWSVDNKLANVRKDFKVDCFWHLNRQLVLKTQWLKGREVRKCWLMHFRVWRLIRAAHYTQPADTEQISILNVNPAFPLPLGLLWCLPAAEINTWLLKYSFTFTTSLSVHQLVYFLILHFSNSLFCTFCCKNFLKATHNCHVLHDTWDLCNLYWTKIEHSKSPSWNISLNTVVIALQWSAGTRWNGIDVKLSNVKLCERNVSPMLLK